MDVGETSHRPELPGYEILRRIDRGDGVDSYLAVDGRGRRVECLMGTAPGGPAGSMAELRAIPPHPHLVPIVDMIEVDIDVDDDDSVASDTAATAVVIDYLQGGTLSALLKEAGALSLGQVVTALEPIARAVAHVHEQGADCGGISADRVFLAASGMPKLLPPSATRAPARGPSNTPDGVAARQRIDMRDLGTLAWTVLTGHTPPDGVIRPPIRVYHPDLPEQLADAIEAPEALTAADFADVVTAAGSSRPDAAPAPLRLVHTDILEPSSDALTAQLRLTARTGNDGSDDEPPKNVGTGRPAPQNSRRARHRRARRRGRVIWVAGGAVCAAGALLAAFALPIGESEVQSISASKQAPSASPVAPGKSASSASSPLPPHIKTAAASDDPVHAVIGLVWIRADMFASADRMRLRQLDAPDSTAWARDAAKLRSLRRSGARLAGLHMSVVSAGQVARHARRAAVQVTVETSGYRQVDQSGHTQARRSGSKDAHRLTLVRRDGRWLISAVD